MSVPEARHNLGYRAQVKIEFGQKDGGANTSGRLFLQSPEKLRADGDDILPDTNTAGGRAATALTSPQLITFAPELRQKNKLRNFLIGIGVPQSNVDAALKANEGIYNVTSEVFNNLANKGEIDLAGFVEAIGVSNFQPKPGPESYIYDFTSTPNKVQPFKS